MWAFISGSAYLGASGILVEPSASTPLPSDPEDPESIPLFGSELSLGLPLDDPAFRGENTTPPPDLSAPATDPNIEEWLDPAWFSDLQNGPPPIPSDPPTSAAAPAAPDLPSLPIAPTPASSYVPPDPNDPDSGGYTDSDENGSPPTEEAELQITSGSFERHYTHSGETADSAFFVDVVISGTISSDPATGGQGSSQILVSETVSYTMWESYQGEYPYYESDSDTTTFETTADSSYPFYSWSSTLGLPTSYGVPAYSWGWDTLGWDHVHWDDSVTYTLSGQIVNGVDDPTYFSTTFGGNFSRDWTVERTNNSGIQTESVRTIEEGDYRHDHTMSTTSTALPSQVQYDDQGRPTDLFEDLQEGLTYYERWFDGRVYESDFTTTRTLNDSTLSVTQGSRSYTGVDGYRFYAKDSLTIGDRSNVSNPAEDHYSWLVDFQQSGTYGGSYEVDITGQEHSPTDGFTKSNWYDEGTIHTDRSEQERKYYRDNGNVRIEGIQPRLGILRNPTPTKMM